MAALPVAICTPICETSRCNQPYRICEPCGKQKLNLDPPRCLLKSAEYTALYEKLYRLTLYNFLDLDFQALLEADSVEGPALYDAFLAKLVDLFDITLGASSPRLVVTQAYGTVVIDTYKGANNTYDNWKAGIISQNLNTHIATLSSQLYEAGVGYSTGLSSITNTFQRFVAIRAGAYLDNPGSFRLSEDIYYPKK